jgi:hypothetical protein
MFRRYLKIYFLISKFTVENTDNRVKKYKVNFKVGSEEKQMSKKESKNKSQLRKFFTYQPYRSVTFNNVLIVFSKPFCENGSFW